MATSPLPISFLHCSRNSSLSTEHNRLSLSTFSGWNRGKDNLWRISWTGLGRSWKNSKPRTRLWWSMPSGMDHVRAIQWLIEQEPGKDLRGDLATSWCPHHHGRSYNGKAREHVHRACQNQRRRSSPTNESAWSCDREEVRHRASTLCARKNQFRSKAKRGDDGRGARAWSTDRARPLPG